MNIWAIILVSYLVGFFLSMVPFGIWAGDAMKERGGSPVTWGSIACVMALFFPLSWVLIFMTYLVMRSSKTL